MQWKPNVTVAAVINKDEQYLLVEENIDNQIVFNQPAGHLEKNETLVDAVKREVLEETSTIFYPQYLTGIYLYNNFNNNITYLRFCFFGTCSKFNNDLALDTGIVRAVWMTLDEIIAKKEQMRSEIVLRSIEDYLAGSKYPLELLNNFFK